MTRRTVALVMHRLHVAPLGIGLMAYLAIELGDLSPGVRHSSVAKVHGMVEVQARGIDRVVVTPQLELGMAGRETMNGGVKDRGSAVFARQCAMADGAVTIVDAG